MIQPCGCLHFWKIFTKLSSLFWNHFLFLPTLLGPIILRFNKQLNLSSHFESQNQWLVCLQLCFLNSSVKHHLWINPSWFYAFTCGFLHHAFLHATSRDTSMLCCLYMLFFMPPTPTRAYSKLEYLTNVTGVYSLQEFIRFLWLSAARVLRTHLLLHFPCFALFWWIVIHVSPINVTPFWVHPTEIILSNLIVVPVTICSHPSILNLRLHLSFALATVAAHMIDYKYGLDGIVFYKCVSAFPCFDTFSFCL